MLKQTGILELPNQVLDLERAGQHLWIAGVDDIWEGHDRLSRVIDRIGDRRGAAVLMAHEPDFADISRQSGRIDLQISGHSHGGQVVLPFIGAPILPRFGEKYPSGLYDLGGMFQYTNRGLGTVPPRIRFNCRPEITQFTLRALTDPGSQ
jgi:predicted MPP superfamily phosphohydrolase